MRQQTDYKKLIGKKDNTYYFLDYVFEDGAFKGATWTTMERLTVEEMNRRVEEYDREDLRKWAVQSNQTRLWLYDWEDSMSDEEKIEIVRDNSYFNEYGEGGVLGEMLGEWYSDCVGGGRRFRLEMCDPSRWDELYAPELLDVIKERESNANI